MLIHLHFVHRRYSSLPYRDHLHLFSFFPTRRRFYRSAVVILHHWITKTKKKRKQSMKPKDDVRINDLREKGKEMKELLCLLTVYVFIVVLCSSHEKKFSSRRCMHSKRPRSSSSSWKLSNYLERWEWIQRGHIFYLLH